MNYSKKRKNRASERGRSRAAGSGGERSGPERTDVRDRPRSEPPSSEGPGDEVQRNAAADEPQGSDDAPRDLEVRPEKPKRRVFSKAYKLAILDEADACEQRGELGALLRREGLYTSHLAQWRNARDRGELDPSVPSRRGPKPNPQAKQLAGELKKAKKREEKLNEELRKARLIIEAQKKVAQLFQTSPEDEDEQDEDETSNEKR